jgi:hypothetical protein
MALVKMSKKGEEEKEPYVHQEYPKFMYHATQKPLVIKSPAVELALGDDWKENPGDFESDKPESKIDPNNHEAYYAMKQADVIDKIDVMTTDDLEALRMLRAVEIANPHKEAGRPAVIKALEEKEASLT